MVEKIYYEDVIGNVLYNNKSINIWIRLLYVVLFLYFCILFLILLLNCVFFLKEWFKMNINMDI